MTRLGETPPCYGNFIICTFFCKTDFKFTASSMSTPMEEDAILCPQAPPTFLQGNSLMTLECCIGCADSAVMWLDTYSIPFLEGYVLNKNHSQLQSFTFISLLQLTQPGSRKYQPQSCAVCTTKKLPQTQPLQRAGSADETVWVHGCLYFTVCVHEPGRESPPGIYLPGSQG